MVKNHLVLLKMVSLDNPKFPIFMTILLGLETYKEGDTPMTKLRSEEKPDDDFLVDLLKERKHENQSKT